jgi:hypothetical protein
MALSLPPGWFTCSIRAFHGRIPFAVVDLITRLRRLRALDSPDLFSDAIDETMWRDLQFTLNAGPVAAWSGFAHIPTLSMGLVFYLAARCQDEPLFTHEAVAALDDAWDAGALAAVVRQALKQAYAGHHRVLAYVCAFLKDAAVGGARLYDRFGAIFFGAFAREGERPRLAFDALLAQFDAVFPRSILAGEITLNDAERAKVLAEFQRTHPDPKRPAGGRRKTPPMQKLGFAPLRPRWAVARCEPVFIPRERPALAFTGVVVIVDIEPGVRSAPPAGVRPRGGQ